jgi:Holliday junction resolvase RusA-like endonuclease
MDTPPTPPLPFEFTVRGLPVSHQSRNKKLLAAWRQQVRGAAAGLWGTAPPVGVALRIAVTYFHDDADPRIDADNMLKPIQDALNGLVYEDDRLILDAQVRKARIDEPIRARHGSLPLLHAFHVGEPFVHVIIDLAPSHSDPLR